MPSALRPAISVLLGLLLLAPVGCASPSPDASDGEAERPEADPDRIEELEGEVADLRASLEEARARAATLAEENRELRTARERVDRLDAADRETVEAELATTRSELARVRRELRRLRQEDGAPSTEDGDRVLAVVNGEEITEDRLLSYTYTRYAPDALDQLIDGILVEQAAAEAGLHGDLEAEVDRWVEDYVSRLRERAGGTEQLRQALSQEGKTLADLRERLRSVGRENALATRLIRERREGGEQTLRQAYEEEYGASREARHILIRPEQGAEDSEAAMEAARARAEELRQQLEEGADFAALAQEHSDDPGTARQGGALGEFHRHQMVPAFEEAAFDLEVGEVSEPVRSRYGWHIIEVTSSRPPSASFEEVRGELEETVRNQPVSNEELQALLEELRSEADIELRDRVLQDEED